MILNQAAGKRHEKLIKDAVESETKIKVAGSIPKIKDEEILPSRHLGLVTPGEYDKSKDAIVAVRKIVKDNVDIDSIIKIAENAENLEEEFFEINYDDSGSGLKLGYFNDKIFSFYYPENLESFEHRGVEWIERIGWPKFFRMSGIPFKKEHIDDFKNAGLTFKRSVHLTY